MLLQAGLIVLLYCWLSIELTHELDLMDVGRPTQIRLLLQVILDLALLARLLSHSLAPSPASILALWGLGLGLFTRGCA